MSKLGSQISAAYSITWDIVARLSAIRPYTCLILQDEMLCSPSYLCLCRDSRRSSSSTCSNPVSPGQTPQVLNAQRNAVRYSSRLGRFPVYIGAMNGWASGRYRINGRKSRGMDKRVRARGRIVAFTAHETAPELRTDAASVACCVLLNA